MLDKPFAGVVAGFARAIAGLIAAKSIRVPMRNTDSLVDIFIRIQPFLFKSSL